MAVVTHARVKYLTDNAIDVIRIQDILEFKTQRPKDKNDFEKGKVYRAEYSDEKNPNTILLKVQISDLACGIGDVEKLINTERPKFKRLNYSDIPNTSSFSNSCSDKSDNEIEIQQKKVSNRITKRNVLRNRGTAILNTVNKKKKISRIIDSDDDSPNKNNFDNEQTNESEIQPQKNLEEVSYTTSSKQNDISIRKSTGNESPVLNNTFNRILTDIVDTTMTAGGMNNGDIYDHNNYDDHFEDENNMKLANTSPHNDSQSSAADKELDHDQESEDYFVSKLVVKSIEYYKAHEGHGFHEKNKRYKPDKEGYLYLGECKRIRPDVWRMMQVEKPNIFLRELLVKLWEPVDLANRALQVEKVLKTIPNRSPVKSIEPNLLRLLISLYSDYLEKRKDLNTDQKASYLRQSTHIISQKIRDLRAEARKKAIGRSNNVPKKRLRYN